MSDDQEGEIKRLKAQIELLKNALRPALESWRYVGFTKAGSNPTRDYYDVRVSREELARMQEAYGPAGARVGIENG